MLRMMARMCFDAISPELEERIATSDGASLDLLMKETLDAENLPRSVPLGGAEHTVSSSEPGMLTRITLEALQCGLQEGEERGRFLWRVGSRASHCTPAFRCSSTRPGEEPAAEDRR